MTFSTIICLSLALFAGVYADVGLRIVGGESTTIEDLPFIVSVRFNNAHFCGGSIISERHILTAAHCIFNYEHLINGITVVTGSTRSYGTDGSTHRISRITVHPDFTGNRWHHLQNDLAVLTLSSNIRFSRSSQKVNLPSRDARVGEILTISGWGSLSESTLQISPILQKAHMTVIGNPMCSANMRASGIPFISGGQMCAFQRRGVGTCHKDSGGLLSANNEIFGVISFGVSCARGFPDVFTRVYAYRSWILRVMAS